MVIPIKQALLEGYDLEAIVEAVHANHPQLNKRRLKDPTTSYTDGKEIENNRKKLANEMRTLRSSRDGLRELSSNHEKTRMHEEARQFEKYANHNDNSARARSQTGGRTGVLAKEFKNFDIQKMNKIVKNVPRVISSAKE